MRQKVWKILSINAKHEINRNTLGSVWEKQTITYSIYQVRMGMRLLKHQIFAFSQKNNYICKKVEQCPEKIEID